MVELHCHSILSDGELIPSELVNYARSAGYEGIVITDHVDHSNLELVANAFRESFKNLSEEFPVLWGVEITHVPPYLIKDMVEAARSLGAFLIIGHGETITEPVPEGTNRAFIEAGVDILAHPGLIKPEDAEAASRRGIYLELSTRKGHCYTNGHVFRVGKSFGAKFVVCNDSHTYGDMLPEPMVKKVLLGAGLEEHETKSVMEETQKLFENLIKRAK